MCVGVGVGVGVYLFIFCFSAETEDKCRDFFRSCHFFCFFAANKQKLKQKMPQKSIASLQKNRRMNQSSSSSSNVASTSSATTGALRVEKVKRCAINRVRCIYLVQTEEHKNTNIYKIGTTMNVYGKTFVPHRFDSAAIWSESCEQPEEMKKMLVSWFDRLYTPMGNYEYAGDKLEMIRCAHMLNMEMSVKYKLEQDVLERRIFGVAAPVSAPVIAPVSVVMKRKLSDDEKNGYIKAHKEFVFKYVYNYCGKRVKSKTLFADAEHFCKNIGLKGVCTPMTFTKTVGPYLKKFRDTTTEQVIYVFPCETDLRAHLSQFTPFPTEIEPVSPLCQQRIEKYVIQLPATDKYGSPTGHVCRMPVANSAIDKIKQYKSDTEDAGNDSDDDGYNNYMINLSGKKKISAIIA